MKSADEIIKGLINSENFNKNKITSLSDEDIQKIIKNTDKNKAIAKMKSMGLGAIADKLSKMSDQELIALLKSNPSIMKSIEKFLK